MEALAMTTKKNSTPGKTKQAKQSTTKDTSRTPKWWDKLTPDERLAEMNRAGLEELKQFAKDYPPALIRTLHENLLEYVHGRLEGAGMKDVAEIISTDMCVLDQYLQFTASGTLDIEAVKDGQDHGLAGELHQTVGKALRLMAEGQKLEAWI
jgi:hypothetical protein